MGNMIPCMCTWKVKVMLPDGTVATYKKPIQVAELVSKYPNYAVVHFCSIATPSPSQHRAVSVMKMEEFLISGKVYILHPIPKSCSDSTPSFRTSDSKLGREMKTEMAEELELNLSRSLMGPTIVCSVPSDCLPVLEKMKEGENLCRSVSCGWTPELSKIAEDSVEGVEGMGI